MDIKDFFDFMSRKWLHYIQGFQFIVFWVNFKIS